ncbi:amidohydrolase [Arthrobacter sp. D5-1]|uniref:amidohydrolase n=1 Tax=Arthrobacter sp. D5-1 TaxID=1477518 RepID=UPI001A996FBC|nr:amidohydrolase [Arthrobacter sp. D5-1]QSZ47879.1 amidohydrolase [Arthrobacter sp. D5-1]
MTIDLEELYKDLHSHPELSFQETRTAGIAAGHLEDLGFTVHRNVGKTGVVGVLDNGPGPVVMLRADMDALPVKEATGLDYASTAVGVDHEGQDMPVMHACGHDVHVTCLVGAVETLATQRNEWQGTLIAVFQPAEEWGGGAETMVADGLYDRVPKPDVVLGQHVAPFPAGWFGIRPGVTMASADSLSITLHGRGGHGSRPETTVDPVLMAAAATVRLQGIVSRELAASDSAVVTVGQIHSGTKNNIIPETASLGLSVRSFDNATREKILGSIERIVKSEATASGAPKEPDFHYEEHFPLTVNDESAVDRLSASFRAKFGDSKIMDPGPVSGSEDVGALAKAADAPLVFWFLGGADPALFKEWATTGRLPDIPSNHSPYFAPVIQPTLTHGSEALVTAAREFLGGTSTN